MKKHSLEIAPSDVESVIIELRGRKVILDNDLARIYGVATKAFNQAVKRNSTRFPDDFLFRLTPAEVAALNRSQFVTGSQRHRDPRFLPWAFTEHGALMAANILNSPRAVAMSVYVIRAFIKIREQLAANAAILKRLAEIDKKLIIHDVTLREILQKLRPLLEPPPAEPKPEIGFHVKEDPVPYRTKRKTALPR
jgi:hypothetical protein